MKLLLDEQIDARLKPALIGLDAYLLSDMGWQGLKNGVLSQKASENEFAFFVTADKNLPFQQNLEKISFAIILLDTPTLLWDHQPLFAPKVIELVREFQPKPLLKIIHVSVEGFDRSKKRERFARLFLPEQIRFI